MGVGLLLRHAADGPSLQLVGHASGVKPLHEAVCWTLKAINYIIILLLHLFHVNCALGEVRGPVQGMAGLGTVRVRQKTVPLHEGGRRSQKYYCLTFLRAFACKPVICKADHRPVAYGHTAAPKWRGGKLWPFVACSSARCQPRPFQVGFRACWCSSDSWPMHLKRSYRRGAPR